MLIKLYSKHATDISLTPHLTGPHTQKEKKSAFVRNNDHGRKIDILKVTSGSQLTGKTSVVGKCEVDVGRLVGFFFCGGRTSCQQ